MCNEEKLHSVRTLVLVHILNFQRDLVVMWFIIIELIICSTSKVDTVKVHIHVVRDVLKAKCLEFKSKSHCRYHNAHRERNIFNLIPLSCNNTPTSKYFIVQLMHNYKICRYN